MRGMTSNSFTFFVLNLGVDDWTFGCGRETPFGASPYILPSLREGYLSRGPAL